MASYRRPVLPDLLAAKLSALGTQLGDEELDDVLADLSALPSNLAVRASHEIAAAARLGWWRHEKGVSFGQLVDRIAEQRLLRKSPEYAWLFLFHPDGYM